MASLQARSDREGAQDGGESCSLIDTMVQKLKFNPKHYLQPNVRTVHSILSGRERGFIDNQGVTEGR